MREQSLGQSHESESAECVYVFGFSGGHHLKFLVDSGASHNFLPGKFVDGHSFREEKGPWVNVRLADGSLRRTSRYVFLWVNFGEISSYLKFTVLDCECPLI